MSTNLDVNNQENPNYPALHTGPYAKYRNRIFLQNAQSKPLANQVSRLLLESPISLLGEPVPPLGFSQSLPHGSGD